MTRQRIYAVAFVLSMVLFSIAMLKGERDMAIIFLGFGILFKVTTK